MPSLRANLNDHTFRSLNLLNRVQESWVLAERGLDRLVKRKCRDPASACPSIRGRSFTSSAGKSERPKPDTCCENRQNKKLSHEVALEMFDARRERVDSTRVFVLLC